MVRRRGNGLTTCCTWPGSQMWEALQADTTPDVDTGSHCTSPYRCPFYSHCHQQVTDHPISDLPRASREFLDGLKKSGIDDIRSIPNDYPGLNALQQQVRECVVNDRAFVGADLQSKLQEINFPVSFLDFETYNPRNILEKTISRKLI